MTGPPVDSMSKVPTATFGYEPDDGGPEGLSGSDAAWPSMCSVPAPSRLRGGRSRRRWTWRTTPEQRYSPTMNVVPGPVMHPPGAPHPFDPVHCSSDAGWLLQRQMEQAASAHHQAQIALADQHARKQMDDDDSELLLLF